MSATSPACPLPDPRSRALLDTRVIADYIELTKPRIISFILMSTAVGFWFGAHNGIDPLLLLSTMLGTGLIASGTFALNQWYERDADSKMRRTQSRPLPTGRVAPEQALLFGIEISAAGFLVLFVGANPLTGLLGLFTLLSYLFVYTPLKQRSHHSTTLGAVPGAMPPLIGFAAATGHLTLGAWVLFAILFLWQFPHFYAIAWMYREDYERAGIRMLPVIEPDGDSTARQILIASVLLLPISILPKFLGMTGNVYLIGAVLMGLLYLMSGVRVTWRRTRRNARQVLLTSVLYLPVLYALMFLNRVA